VAGHFLIASMACGDLVASMPTPIDEEDSLVVSRIFAANGHEKRQVRPFVDVDEEGRIIRLNLQGNGLTVLPAEIGELTALRSLNLADNRLKDIPEAFERLIDLEDVWLQNNLIAALPEGLRFGRVKRVDLHSNVLAALPSNFDVTSVEDLDLSGNRLERLPPDFRYLHRLVRLDLRNNRLDSLDVDFSGLASLRTLDLAYNHLAYLDPSLQAIAPDFLDLAGNWLCPYLREDADSSALGMAEWLDETDRDWRETQRCP
jgi:hypothetical protein